MKKILVIALAVLMGVAFVTTVFAQTDKPAAATEKPKAAKAKTQTFKGEFVSTDATAKTLDAKNDKGTMTFDVSKIKKMPDFKAGDKVSVVYSEKDGKMQATSVKAVKAAKAAKKEAPKKDEKPADKPAATPAAPAAPAKK
ncbi:MAG TPA: hypothetical protein VMT62_16565 [Syntrophorhabdaceae bacterium]|nr:hypothetical protein [Syntrophorhabdaceae bacterium]